MVQELEKLAVERADIFQRTSVLLAGEEQGLALVANDSRNLVRFLSFMWNAVQGRLCNGGAPAKQILQECDLLISLSTQMRHRLAALANELPETEQSVRSAQPANTEIQAVINMLDSLIREVSKVREQAAIHPRLSADPEELKRRVQQGDEKGEWLKLSEVVAGMRQGASLRKE